MSQHEAGTEPLRAALTLWIQKACTVLEHVNPLPGMREMVFTVEGDSARGEAVVKPDYYELVRQNLSALGALAEIDAVRNVAHSFAPIGDVFRVNEEGVVRTDENERSLILYEQLLPFIAEYLIRAEFATRSDKSVIDEDAFAQTYSLFIQSIFAFETVPVRWLVQFDNVRLDVDDIELEPGVHLRRPTDRERLQALEVHLGNLPTDRYTRHWDYVNPARPMDVTSQTAIPSAFLEIHDNRHLPRDHSSTSHAAAFGQRLLTVLRLVQPSDIGIHSIWHVDDNPFGRMPWPRWLWRDPLPQDPGRHEAVVTPEVASEVVKLWPSLASPFDSTLELALRRLNDSYHRSRQDDRHVDYWIALEALFLRVNEGELSYRAALLIARYIGVDPIDRLDHFKEVKKSYDLRSTIVHGSPPPKKCVVPDMVNWTGVLLRRILYNCLINKQSPDLDRLRDELLK